MNKLTFLSLEIKRKLKILPYIIAAALALCLVSGILVFCSGKLLYNTKSQPKKKQITFSSQDSSKLATMIVGSLSKSKSISAICEVNETDYDSAMAAISQENNAASIIVPGDFLYGVMHGKTLAVPIYFSSSDSIYTALITELSKAAQTSFKAAQAGIYTLNDYYYDNGAHKELIDANDELNLIYIGKTLTRDKFFQKQKLSATGSLSLQNYYLASGILLVIMLLGCVIILKSSEISPVISYKLLQNNVGLIFQTLAQLISTFLVTYLIYCLLFIGINIKLDVASPIVFLINGIFICLCCSSIVCFSESAFSDTYSGILFHFLFCVIMSFVSGAFIPGSILPGTFNKISRYLPSTFLHKEIGFSLNGVYSSDALLCISIFTLTFITLSILLKKMRFYKKPSPGKAGVN